MKAAVTPPETWRDLTLADVARWSSGGTPKAGTTEYYGGDIPWAVIGDLNNGVVTSTASTITEAGLSSSSAKVVPTGTLLVAMYGSIGKLGIAGIPMATNQAIACAVPNSDIDTQYLFHYLKSQREDLLHAGKGGAQQNISQTVLKTWPIPVPPLDEQRRLAIWLDEIDVRRASIADRVSAARTIVDRLRAAVLAAACSGRLTADWREDDSPAAPPPSWSRVALGDLVASIRGGSTEVPRDDPSPFPILRSSSVRPFTVDYADVRYLSVEQSGRADNFITNGDLLVTRLSGSLEFVGNAARVQGVDELSVQYPDRLFRLRLADAGHAEYLEIFMASQETRRQVAAATRSAAGHQRISISDLRAFEVNLPPLAEQQEIVRRTRAALESADRVENAISVATSALGTAMRAAFRKTFRGELIPSGTELVTA